MGFKNKVVIVTGAGSGIGEAAALHFAKLSANLSLADINTDNLERSVRNCRKINNTKVLKANIDVAKEKDVKNMIEDTVRELGGIDVLVNCASAAEQGELLDPDAIDRFDRIMAINFRSVVTITNFAIPALIERRGCIINISSNAAIAVLQNTFAYNVSKACVDQFTRCIARELASKGVRVNSVLPGPTRTNIMLNAGVSSCINDLIFNALENQLPLKRVAEPEDIAELLVFLASEKAASMTGGNYLIDSGVMLSDIRGVPKL